MDAKELKEFLDKAEETRLQLEKKTGANGKSLYGKVKMLVLSSITEDEKPAVGYFMTGTTATKMKCIDVMYSGSTMKAYELYFDSTVIREHTDKRFFQKDGDNDAYFLRAINWCGEQIQYAIVLVKKK